MNQYQGVLSMMLFSNDVKGTSSLNGFLGMCSMYLEAAGLNTVVVAAEVVLSRSRSAVVPESTEPTRPHLPRLPLQP